VNAGAITLVGNVFQTGQAIVYHGTSNAVLVDGQTYYAVVDSNDPSKFGLATSLADATAATPLLLGNLGAISGSANYFSAAQLTFGSGAVASSDDTITLAQSIWQTGQAVVYHSDGASIGGLTDGT